ncbi:hypothetical protein P2318_26250 [Myxococcaceae bacterium GXIMD 01537]
MIARRMGALLLVVLLGCGGPQRLVRLDTGEGEAIVHVPRVRDVEPVKVGREEFQDSL